MRMGRLLLEGRVGDKEHEQRPQGVPATWETSPLVSVLGGRLCPRCAGCGTGCPGRGTAQVPGARDVLFALELVPAAPGSRALGTLRSGLSRQET